MSEDVNPTPEGASQETGAGAETPQIPDALKWVIGAKPEEIAQAILTLQEKSTTRLSDLQAKDAELAKLRAAQKQAEDAKLAEQQKWQELAEQRAQELAAKDTELRSAAIDRLVVEAASTLKFHNWQEAKKLADLSGVDTSTTDGGASAVKNALQALAKSSPHLIQSETSTTAQPKQGAGVMNPAGKIALTASDLEKMSPQEVLRLMQENPDAVDAALRNPNN